MRRHDDPLDFCDAACAAANDCAVGGYQCEGCGRYFCADELDECGYCEACAREAEREAEAEAEGEEADKERRPTMVSLGKVDCIYYKTHVSVGGLATTVRPYCEIYGRYCPVYEYKDGRCDMQTPWPHEGEEPDND